MPFWKQLLNCQVIRKKGQKQAGGSGIERQGQNSETAQRFKLHDWHLTECGR